MQTIHSQQNVTILRKDEIGIAGFSFYLAFQYGGQSTMTNLKNLVAEKYLVVANLIQFLSGTLILSKSHGSLASLAHDWDRAKLL